MNVAIFCIRSKIVGEREERKRSLREKLDNKSVKTVSEKIKKIRILKKRERKKSQKIVIVFLKKRERKRKVKKIILLFFFFKKLEYPLIKYIFPLSSSFLLSCLFL